MSASRSQYPCESCHGTGDHEDGNPLERALAEVRRLNLSMDAQAEQQVMGQDEDRSRLSMAQDALRALEEAQNATGTPWSRGEEEALEALRAALTEGPA